MLEVDWESQMMTNSSNSNDKNNESDLVNFDKSFVPSFNLDKYTKKLLRQEPFTIKVKGRVTQITGMVVKAKLINARIGEVCSICPPGRSSVKAQVVGFDDEDVYLTPLDTLYAVGPKTVVINSCESLKIGVGFNLLGRVVNSLGESIDGKGKIETSVKYFVKRKSPEAMERRRITEVLPTRIRAIDSLLTVGEGQRMGVFSGAGVGKSSLLGMIARGSYSDVNIVALVGERGREVLDFLEESLGKEGLKKSVVVVSTSDEPPLRRIMAAYSAMAIAEYFRDQGKKVMLLMDSLTRFARAHREIALSVGEPPARQGYPPSVFSALPELLERAGKTALGSITAFYTVLLSTEQIEDPLGEEIRAILDGHIYLTSKLAQSGHFPAIDILKSNSRLMSNIVDSEHIKIANKIREYCSVYEENRDLISIGAYRKGSDESIDEAIKKQSQINSFLIQPNNELTDMEKTLGMAKKAILD